MIRKPSDAFGYVPFQGQVQHLHLCDDRQYDNPQWLSHAHRIGHGKQVAEER